MRTGCAFLAHDVIMHVIQLPPSFDATSYDRWSRKCAERPIIERHPTVYCYSAILEIQDSENDSPNRSNVLLILLTTQPIFLPFHSPFWPISLDDSTNWLFSFPNSSWTITNLEDYNKVSANSYSTRWNLHPLRQRVLPEILREGESDPIPSPASTFITRIKFSLCPWMFTPHNAILNFEMWLPCFVHFC